MVLPNFLYQQFLFMENHGHCFLWCFCLLFFFFLQEKSADSLYAHKNFIVGVKKNPETTHLGPFWGKKTLGRVWGLGRSWVANIGSHIFRQPQRQTTEDRHSSQTARASQPREPPANGAFLCLCQSS